MNLFSKGKAGLIAALAAAFACSYSCVKVDETTAGNFISENLKYNIRTAEFDIDDIRMQMPDSMSGYSLYRFTFGAIRDDVFGLTTRSCAFSIVPVMDSLDFGKAGTQKLKYFRFHGVKDTTSTITDDQKFILQNVNVYELEKAIDFDSYYPGVKHSSKRITHGIPVYNGSGELNFDFSKEFGEKYMNILLSDYDSLGKYTAKFPGIYIETDSPVGEGGRINMFKVPIDATYSVTTGSSINGSYATLAFSAEYGTRGVIDTTFMFYFGPTELFDMSTVTSTDVSTYPQLAYNMATHETESMAGKVGETIYFEGGRGLKPVIKAESLRKKIRAVVSKECDPDKAIINSATLVFPFELPENMDDLGFYPTILSPTCRIEDEDGGISFAGLTDDSNSENSDKGNINRSLCTYEPDIPHHIQEIMKLESTDKIENYDIWLLPMANEIVSTTTSSNDDMSEYYQYLAYNSYYNSMYGGYGGYGGYGSRYSSSYYSNYYNYLSMAQYYSSSATTQSTEAMLDYHRWYKAMLNGPESKNKPKVKITFCYPKE